MAYLRHATLAFEGVLFGWMSKAKALLSFSLFLRASATSQECCDKEIHDLLRTRHQINLISWGTRRRKDHGWAPSVQAIGDLTHLPSYWPCSALFRFLTSVHLPPNLYPRPFPCFSLLCHSYLSSISPLSSPYLSIPPHMLGGKEERQAWD